MAYLHNEGVVHGDLHGGNILVDDVGNACVHDFGMSLIADAIPYNYGSMHGGGIFSFRAPELHDPEQFGLGTSRPTFRSDIFSFACVCTEVRQHVLVIL